MSARGPRSIRRGTNPKLTDLRHDEANYCGFCRQDPACGTCRRKCRKCDRARPFCNRCQSKGLRCDGYPPRFQFCDLLLRPEELRRVSRNEEVDLFLSGSDEPQRGHPDEQIRTFSVSPTTGESDVQTENSPVQIPVSVEQQWEDESQNSPQLLPTSSPAPNISATGSTIDDILMEDETQMLLVHCKKLIDIV